MTLISDPGFWRVFEIGALSAVAICITIRTARTPLFWLAVLLACLEAGLRQAWASAAVAGTHYWVNYPETLRQVKRQVASIAEPPQ